MIKFIIKLAIAAVIANAAWRLGSAYVTFYRFKDAVTEVAQFNPQTSPADLRQRVVELASQYDIPLAADGISVRRDDRNHTYINGSYTQPVDLFPGYQYPWEFSWAVDVLSVPGAVPGPSNSR